MKNNKFKRVTGRRPGLKTKAHRDGEKRESSELGDEPHENTALCKALQDPWRPDPAEGRTSMERGRMFAKLTGAPA